jgi:hypothetical protein
MTKSPIFWIGVGVAGTWAWHHFLSPLPAPKGA